VSGSGALEGAVKCLKEFFIHGFILSR
jgi:hypothetical protein